MFTPLAQRPWPQGGRIGHHFQGRHLTGLPVEAGEIAPRPLRQGPGKGKPAISRSRRSASNFRTQALARRAAQHEETVHLRGAADASNRLTRLPSARTTVIGSSG